MRSVPRQLHHTPVIVIEMIGHPVGHSPCTFPSLQHIGHFPILPPALNFRVFFLNFRMAYTL